MQCQPRVDDVLDDDDVPVDERRVDVLQQADAAAAAAGVRASSTTSIS